MKRNLPGKSRLGCVIMCRMNSGFGKLLIATGIIILVCGICVLGNVHIPWLGKLPGDISVKKENFSFYFPLTTCLIVSILLSFLFYLFRR